MKIPVSLPVVKWLIVAIGLYSLVWISLEGALWQAILLGAGLVLLGALHLTQRLMGGRQIPVKRWLLFCAALGGIAGAGCALLVLALMAVKTGLHGHGPEFTPSEISWIVGQVPLWAVAGIMAGLGVGILALATQRG